MTDNDDPSTKETTPSKDQIVEKLKGECTEADWSMLKPHYSRGALISVSKDLNLFEVGATISLDEVDQLQAWMKEGLVRQLNAKEADRGEQDPYKKTFQFVIVQPYVLVQRT